MSLSLHFDADDNRRLAHLCGALDEHLRAVEAGMNVNIRRRGADLRIEGEPQQVRQARDLLRTLYDQADHALDAETVHLAIVQSKHPGSARDKAPRESAAASAKPKERDPAPPHNPNAPAIGLPARRTQIMARTPNQARYLQQILNQDLTFGIGPAGTGKTYLAVACAVDALERSAVQRIVLTRPAVEAGERLGFLPGDLTQKVDPYLRPLYDALYDLMGFERVTKAFEKGLLEVAPLAFMRGRTLNHSFIILDEAQNTTPEQMKMFLTRMGFGSRVVVTGDVSQIDLPRGAKSGLIDAERILRRVEGVGFTRFTSADVVRNALVARIVQAYDEAQSSASDASPPADAEGGAPAQPPLLTATPSEPTAAAAKRRRSGNKA